MIGVCIAAGLLLRRFKIIPADAHKGVNTWIIYLAIPAVALKYIPSIQWRSELLLPAIMPLIVWCGSWLFFKLLSTRISMTVVTRTALTLTAGLGNTSFVGFPLIQAYYGEHAIGIAVISDQVSFAILSTIGSVMAMSAAGSGTDARSVIVKLIKFPPFIAFALAIVVPRVMDITPLNPLFDKIAVTLVPMALFTVGLQLNFSGWQSELKLLVPGLAYKLLLAPGLIAFVALVFHLKGLVACISIFEASMAPMITAAVVADNYQLNPKLANLMAGIGLLVSFLTTGLWWLVLQYIV